MTWDQILRTCIVFTIMATIFGWWMSIRVHRPIWLRSGDVRAFLVSLGVLPVLIVNGIGIVYAATKGLPVTWVTYSYAGAYILLNGLMYWPVKRTESVPSRRASDHLH